jgi:hypothetical protein
MDTGPRADGGVDASGVDSDVPCDPQTYPTSCKGNDLISCSGGKVTVTDCAAMGAVCQYFPSIKSHGCGPAPGTCNNRYDCQSPPAPSKCLDAMTSEYYEPSCPSGTCVYTKTVKSCKNTDKPFCSSNGFTLHEPIEGSCSYGSCTGGTGSWTLMTCFGGCSNGACNPASGLTWTAVPFSPGSGATNPVTGIFARGPSDVLVSIWWFSLWHYNGSSWTKLQAGTYYGLWATGSHIFAAGDKGLFKHYDGSSWATLPSVTTETFAGTHGTSATSVWSVGSKGTIAYYNGTTAVLQQSGTTEDLTGVFAVAADNVYAVGENGVILNYNGSTWSAKPSGQTTDIYSVWAADAANVFVVGPGGILKGSGATWAVQSVPAPPVTFRDVWGSSKSDVFVVGDGGWIVHYDGSKWTAQDSKVDIKWSRVSGAGPNEVYVGGASETIRVGK